MLSLVALRQCETARCCRNVLNKKARSRPSASMLLEHPWIVKNMAQEVGAPVRRPEIEHLLEPIPIYHIASADDQVVEAGNGMDAMDTLAQESRVQRRSDTPNSSGRSVSPVRHLGGRGAVSFSVPSENITGVEIFQLSPEEKGETGAAVGMKARLQLYMNRQRL